MDFLQIKFVNFTYYDFYHWNLSMDSYVKQNYIDQDTYNKYLTIRIYSIKNFLHDTKINYYEILCNLFIENLNSEQFTNSHYKNKLKHYLRDIFEHGFTNLLFDNNLLFFNLHNNDIHEYCDSKNLYMNDTNISDKGNTFFFPFHRLNIDIYLKIFF